MMTFIAVLLAPLMGIGIATFIIGVFLAPNNIGDSVGSKFQYTGNPKYDCRIDDAGREYCEYIASEYYMKATGGSQRKEVASCYWEETESDYQDNPGFSLLKEDDVHSDEPDISEVSNDDGNESLEDNSFYVGTVKVTPLGKSGSSVQDDFDEELPPSDKPAFKPRDDKD